MKLEDGSIEEAKAPCGGLTADGELRNSMLFIVPTTLHWEINEGQRESIGSRRIVDISTPRERYWSNGAGDGSSKLIRIIGSALAKAGTQRNTAKTSILMNFDICSEPPERSKWKNNRERFDYSKKR